MKTNSERIILVVDDKPANIQVAHNILKDTYIIKIATNGAKALDLAKVLPQPDLILLDVMMPEMDGYEVCSRLKVRSRHMRHSRSFFSLERPRPRMRRKDSNSERSTTFTNRSHLLWFRRAFGHTLRCAKPASSWRRKSVKWIASSTISFRRPQSPRSS